ncbi:salivary glue protein Sgs-3-like [Branchiostoma floridae]|uniref:Salivary glue protein Sgs-3-like n=1 Tax=Branchiostoma floridae TaxID=7739 RepID=A0A9J7N980_BRAFL|nr:salivary glue protein Sgs-3-like [Branchiostoma floridae]
MAVLRKIAAVFFLLVRLKTEVTAQTVTTQAAVQDCPRGLYQCDSGLCISTNWRCNGRDNCGDGSDERDCTTTTAGSHTLSVTTTLENNPTTQDTSTSATSSTHHLTTTDSTTVQPLATTAESQTSSVTITLANNPTTQATSTDAISSTPHLTTIVPTTVQPLATTAQADTTVSSTPHPDATRTTSPGGKAVTDGVGCVVGECLWNESCCERSVI